MNEAYLRQIFDDYHHLTKVSNINTIDQEQEIAKYAMLIIVNNTKKCDIYQ